MTLAKGKLFVSRAELEKLFGIPEEVEILAIKTWQDGFEFLLASPEEEFTSNGTQVTVNSDGFSNLRRVSLESLKNTVEYKADGFRISTNGDMTLINGNEKIEPSERYDVNITINQVSDNPADIARRIGESLKSVGERIRAEKKPRDESIEDVFEQAVNNSTKKGKK